MAKNFKNKRADAISPYLLVFWFLGDSCNLVGTVLTDAQPIQKIIASSFICQDTVLCWQLFYYSWFYFKKSGKMSTITSSPTPPPPPSLYHLPIGTFLAFIFAKRAAGHARDFAGLDVENESLGFWEQVFAGHHEIVSHHTRHLSSHPIPSHG